ncbi:MAG: restriction endonuclease subunit S [Selenomonadaceae bacterium]|nr:restriction endonuclease subunit S [Selenomonadaceae bacterium]
MAENVMEYKSLKELTKITMGQSPDSSSYNEAGEGMPFYQGNADFGEVYPTPRVWCNAPKKIAHAGDILISVRAPIGALNYANEECCIGRGLAAITIDDPANRSYIFHLLKARNEELNRQGTGSTFKAISRKVLETVQVPMIGEEERENSMKLMDVLESVIKDRKRQLVAFDELVKARFVEMFGEVTHTEKMKDLCFIITDGTHQPPKFEHTGIPFIFVSNIAGNELTYNAEKFINQETYDELIKRTPIEIGDIVLSTVGSYGHPAVVKSDKKFLFQRHIAYLKPNHELIDSEYLHSAILSDKVQRQIDVGVKGIAQKTLNLSSIKDLDIAVPSIQEQEKFAAFKGQVEKSKAAVHRSLEETQTLFDSLMQTYFG